MVLSKAPSPRVGASAWPPGAPSQVPPALGFKILAVGGLKGGIGKSTVAIGVATEAHARGLSVLLVDADPTATTRTWNDVAAERGHAGPTVVAMGPTMHQPGQLAKLAAGYDLVVIDCPPQDDRTQRSALAIADLVLLPCGPGVSEAWALGPTAQLIAKARDVRPALRAWVVVNKLKPKTALGKGVREVLARAGLPVLKTALADRVTYQEFLASGRGVGGYAPSSLAALEVRKLLDEVESLAVAEA